MENKIDALKLTHDDKVVLLTYFKSFKITQHSLTKIIINLKSKDNSTCYLYSIGSYEPSWVFYYNGRYMSVGKISNIKYLI